MKHRTKIFLMMVLLFTVMTVTGCSTYDEDYEEGPWSAVLNRGDGKSFVLSYTWDGTEEGLYIKPPEAFDGCTCTRIGGYYGRGLPCRFTIKIPGMTQCIEPARGSKMTELVFTLYIGENINDILLSDYPMYWRKNNEDGTHEFYRVKIKEEPDPKSKYYTGEGKKP